MKLTELLKNATANLHATVECSYLAQKISSRAITSEEYIILLRRLLYVHKQFEMGIARYGHVLNAIWHDYMLRSPDIVNDLIHLKGNPDPLPSRHVDLWIEQVTGGVWPTLGVLYVFEGSRLGSSILVDCLAEALQLPTQIGAGLDYHLRYREQRYDLWNRFRNAVNVLRLSRDEVERVVKGAQDTFTMLVSVYGSPVRNGSSSICGDTRTILSFKDVES